MDCLRCGNAMRKFPLDGVLIDKCDNCQGVWLDADELDRIKYDDGKEQNELAREIRSEQLAEKRRLMTTVGLCPKCQRSKLTTFIRSGVEIDQCPTCFGLFFDHGELQRLIANEHNGIRKFLYGIKKTLKGRK